MTHQLKSCAFIRLTFYFLFCVHSITISNAQIVLTAGSINRSTCSNGDTVSVPIFAQNFNDVGSVSLELTYDSTVLTFLNYDSSQIPTSGTFFLNSVSGRIIVSWFSATPLSLGNSRLFNLVFRVHGSSAINWDCVISTQCQITNTLGSNFPLSLINGSISTPVVRITQEPQDTLSLNAGASGSLTVLATGSTGYRWQIWNAGSSWLDLNNDNTYSGVFTPTLAITANTSINQSLFRVIVFGGSCGNDTSDVSSLSVTNFSLPTVSTIAPVNITLQTAVCGGQVTSDGGATVTVRGVAYGIAQNPTTSGTSTSDGGGLGTFSSTLTGLTPSTLYYVRAYATNSVGTAYGSQLSFSTTAPAFACGTQSATDVDGNSYNTVQIGSQCWMQGNLRVTKYRNGAQIPTGLSNSQWNSTTSGAFAVYSNTNINDTLFGKLYNWFSAIDSRGLCPTGWHVPTNSEWSTLITFLGGGSQAGGAMKSTLTQPAIGAWQTPNTGATNSSGFAGLPGGLRNVDGTYDFVNTLGFWWSTTTSPIIGESWIRDLSSINTIATAYHTNQKCGLSVRCLRD